VGTAIGIAVGVAVGEAVGVVVASQSASDLRSRPVLDPSAALVTVCSRRVWVYSGSL
jgi:gas vesicle protein